MPWQVGRPRDHRDKTASLGIASCPALVARPVGEAEIASTPAAAQPMDHEWNRRRNKCVWEENDPRDWADVRHEARLGGFDVHLEHICGMCVEKSS